MGKYSPSFLHGWFSDWHWRNCGRKAGLTDIDRLWIEIRAKTWLQEAEAWRIDDATFPAIFDLKYPYDSPNFCEPQLIKFFENKNSIPFYRVYPFDVYANNIRFTIVRPTTKQIAFLKENEMIEWIRDNNVSLEFFNKKCQPLRLEDYL